MRWTMPALRYYSRSMMPARNGRTLCARTVEMMRVALIRICLHDGRTEIVAMIIRRD
jgi:hypothetical protein